jgi:4-amino-4-deoxy-L-arabinose transferase-like glycosyltransferase
MAAMNTSSRWRAPVLAGLLALPLLLSLAPRSLLAHDEGFYALQARWILESGDWLTPQSWGTPLYDRTIGLQWLIAASSGVFGMGSFAVHLPGWLAAAAAVGFSWRLSRSWVAAAVLVLTPLWFSYAHMATQDMPLLALELLGLWGLSTRRPWAAGLWLGPAFLIKGFMAVLPALAMLPLLLLERRALLRSPSLWAAVVAGWLPPLLWLALSLQRHGLAVVSQLWGKLLWLSGETVFAQGPLYYLWNIPANTAPWGLIAPLGWWLLWRRWRRGTLTREAALLWLGYPLLLLLLLNLFKTKTPYYALQLTPFIAMAAATALQQLSGAAGRRWLWLRMPPVLLGTALVLAGLAAPVPAMGAVAPGWLRAAAVALGLCWLLSCWQPPGRSRLVLWLVGPYLALVCLLQGGVFIDHSPAVRLKLANPAVRAALERGPVHFLAAEPAGDEAQKEQILLALGAPQLGSLHQTPETLPPGVPVWRLQGNSWQLQTPWSTP